MSKYKPLADFLAGHVPDEWRVTFDELEKTLGSALPKTAREKAAWWLNDETKPHAKAWLGAGWKAEVIDPGTGEVIFRRGEARPEAAPDSTAHQAMAAADAAFEKTKVVDTAKKVGLVAAVVGVIAAGVGVAVKVALGRKK